jgi:hypothetical protein
MTANIKIVHPPWMVAHGDENQLVVTRSLIVRETDDIWQPVREFVREHGLVLMDQSEHPMPGAMFGTVETLWYGNPQFRNGVLGREGTVEDFREALDPS